MAKTRLDGLRKLVAADSDPKITPITEVVAMRDEIMKAEAIARVVHYGQTFQNEIEKGQPFIAHPQAVAESVDITLKSAAWLHDVIEDSEGYVTAGHLLAAGISPSTVEVVEILTRRDGEETYTEYIERIASSGNMGAIVLKLADLAHNRRPSCPESLVERYRDATYRLTLALPSTRTSSPAVTP